MKLLQVVPRLPDAFEGVGGYAGALARGLARCGVASSFLAASATSATSAASAASPGAGEPAGASLRKGGARQLSRRLADSGADAVLVHYANYGYQRRGCPFWLVGGVSRWRAAAPGRRLVTMFHEVYATGPPWRSSFWLSPLQRRLAARLLRASDGAATSLALYARLLGRWGPRGSVTVAPVLSAVGEPAAVPPPGERRPRTMLVFGSPGIRRRAYGDLGEALGAACRALAIAEIVDLGPPLAELPARIAGLPVRILGPRPDGEVSDILLRSYAGFLGYPATFLPKSTIFAAYCAHGLLPVCAWRRQPTVAADERPPFWEPGAEPAPADPCALAAAAHAWYGEHDLARQAAAFRDLLRGGSPAAGRTAALGAASRS